MRVKLENFLQKTSEKTTENNQYPILTASKAGLFLQSDYFNKQVASKDNAGYKVIRRGQFTYRAMSDTGEFFPNMLECADIGIVSPAYPVFRITKPEIIIPAFLKYFFKSDSFQHSISSFAQGSTRTSVKFSKIKTVSINLPSIVSQRHIVEVLDKTKAIIADREQELQKLDDLVKARFVEMFGDPITNDKGWDVVELNSVCDGIGDGLHGTPEYDDSGEYPFINGNNLMNGVIEITPATKMVNEDTYKKHFIELTKNAILLSINGTLGKLAFYNGENVMLGKSACYCNLKSEINREFVYGVMTTDAFARFLESNATASTIKNVGLKAIRGFKLILPPENLQNQFVEFSKQVDKSKFAVQKALHQAQVLFDSLMRRYFG